MRVKFVFPVLHLFVIASRLDLHNNEFSAEHISLEDANAAATQKASLSKTH